MSQNSKRLKSIESIGHGAHIKTIERRTDTYPLHSHDYFEIEIFIEGEGKTYLNSQEHIISKGSICILTPADIHSVFLNGENLTWNISFDESIPSAEMLETLFSLKEHIRVIDEYTLNKIVSATKLLSEETDIECIRLLLTYILKQSGLCHQSEETITPIKRALLYMQTYFRNDPTLADTAAHVGLSASYFGAKFHEITGETYIGYLNNCKVNYAMRMLDSGKNVTETCFEAGFGSLSGFRYIFKQKVGMSPSEYLDSKISNASKNTAKNDAHSAVNDK